MKHYWPSILLLLAGCVTLSPDGERVQLHESTSTVIATCKRLGAVSGEESRAISREHAQRTAIGIMREQAFRQYAADFYWLMTNQPPPERTRQ